MILIIDCFKQVKGHGKSIGIYNLAKNLIANLAKENNKLKQIDEIVVLGNEENRADFQLEGVTFVTVSYNPFNKWQCILWELFYVKKYMKKYNGNRILFPRGYAPMFFAGKSTIIIHDLIPFFYHENYPGVFNPIENFYIMKRLKASIKSAERVITISEYSKKEIERRIPSAKGKIKVIYNGLNDLPERKENPNAGEKQETAGYLCAMTSKLPHKNAKGVLEAYKTYWNMTNNPLPIKIIGIQDITTLDMGDAARDVTCYPYIKSDEELTDLIAGSEAFWFLSLIEGFGFPPLEAMQLGVPVICSGRTSLPEVVGEAAIIVDPEDPKEVADKTVSLLADKEQQEKLKDAGYENCKRFDWESRIKMYMEELTIS